MHQFYPPVSIRNRPIVFGNPAPRNADLLIGLTAVVVGAAFWSRPLR